MSCLPNNSFILSRVVWLFFHRRFVWWWMSESEKMTNHTQTREGSVWIDKSCYAHNRHIVQLSCRWSRYAFVMSLSSHFSIQIQNNCVIMNVDTNQPHLSHSHLPSTWDDSLIVFICSFHIKCMNCFESWDMNLCTHIQMLRHYVPLHVGYVCFA